MQKALRASKFSADVLVEQLESLTIPHHATLGQSWISFCRHFKLAAPIGDQEVVFDWLWLDNVKLGPRLKEPAC